jgi:solute carrier family 30 (zinc transporter), member 2
VIFFNLDISGFLISLFAITWSRKPASTKLSYGYHRIEILGALFSISIVWALTIFLLIEAISRMRKTEAVEGKIMFITASLGLVVNIAYVK